MSAHIDNIARQAREILLKKDRTENEAILAEAVVNLCEVVKVFASIVQAGPEPVFEQTNILLREIKDRLPEKRKR